MTPHGYRCLADALEREAKRRGDGTSTLDVLLEWMDSEYDLYLQALRKEVLEEWGVKEIPFPWEKKAKAVREALEQ